ncbi:MAG TPA: AMP-binding protein [Syntrophobacteraceae bacterium]|nr:AMP-binding protein [Syntrophobacteraceae bacterium]
MRVTPLESWISGKIGNRRGNLTRREIEAYQLEKLRETIRWARTKSSLYKTRLAHTGEDKVCRLGDLERLPFTSSEDIRRNPLELLCVSQGEINRVVTLATSGTTGDPKRIYFTLDDQEATIDFFHHGMSTLARPGDRVLILLPADRPGSVGDLLAKGIGRLGALGIAHGPVRDLRNTLHVMERERVDSLVGIPVQVLALARHWSGNVRPVRNVLLSTDYVPGAIIRELRRIWGCEVFTHYGMTEMGYGGGVECAALFGYHLREADLLLEIIDPATGDPVEEGKPGEVVFTTLTRRGMPLIRYRTGDISRFIAEKCPCGTMLKSMERVRGRTEGNLKIGSGVALSMVDLDEALFPLPGLLDFSAVLTGDYGKDRLCIEILAMEANGEKMASRARSAVDSIPAVRAACREGALSVSVAVRREAQTGLMGVGKRRIVDLR